MDEFQYWGDMARSDERASQFVDLFKPISKEFGGLDTMEMMDVMELVEIAQDTLDDVWKFVDFDAYPEPRMKHLMDVIGKMTSGFKLLVVSNTYNFEVALVRFFFLSIKRFFKYQVWYFFG